MKAFGVEITEQEMAALLKYFDTSMCGRISLNEMLHAMRSNSMNEAREAAVTAAYNKFDAKRD
jgi:Ca2+-binding EF-hand superfamily protein